MCNLALVGFVSATPAVADPVEVVMLGDSLTAGYGLPAQEGLVPQLQAWLDANGESVVLTNAGVSGDTTAGGLSRLDWTLGPDVDGLIVALGGNDYLRGLDPAVTKANLDGILAKAIAADLEVLLVGITAGANYGTEYQESFNAVYSDLAATYDVPLQATIFEGLLIEAGTQDAVLSFLQRDGIHPNAQGVAAMVETLGPRVQALSAKIRDGE